MADSAQHDSTLRLHQHATEKQTSCKGMSPSKMQSECRLLAAESFKCMEKHTKEAAKVIVDKLPRACSLLFCVWFAVDVHF